MWDNPTQRGDYCFVSIFKNKIDSSSRPNSIPLDFDTIQEPTNGTRICSKALSKERKTEDNKPTKAVERVIEDPNEIDYQIFMSIQLKAGESYVKKYLDLTGDSLGKNAVFVARNRVRYGK